MNNKVNASKCGFVFTFNKFWEIESGANMEIEKQIINLPTNSKVVVLPFRISASLNKQLKKKYNIDAIICITSLSVLATRVLRGLFYRLKLKCPYYLLRPFRFSRSVKRRVRNLVKNYNCDLLLCEYIWYAHLFDYVFDDNNIFKIIETHDIQSKYADYAKRSNNGIVKTDVTEEEELSILSRFDLVLAISRNDEKYFSSRLGSKVMYLPSVLTGEEKANNINKSKSPYFRVGFLGNGAAFNIDAVNWIIDAIKSINFPDDIIFNIIGKVCDHINQTNLPDNIVFHGLIKNIEDVYINNDVMVNPTFQSGGIKTKNIEAFLYKTPVITTTIGSYGMESASKYGCMFIADTIEAFASIIMDIYCDRSIAEAASDRCSSFMDDNFNSRLFDLYIDRINKSISQNRESV